MIASAFFRGSDFRNLPDPGDPEKQHLNKPSLPRYSHIHSQDLGGMEASSCREDWQELRVSADESMVDIDTDTILHP